MTSIPPTTTYEIEAPDECPECGAQVELVSPPIGYECRDCMREFTLAEVNDEGEVATDDVDTCQEVMTNGEICGRDLPCQYHG